MSMSKKRRLETMSLPKSVLEIIAWYAATYEISPWIKALGYSEAGITPYLCSNPMAMDIISTMKNIDWSWLSANSADWAVDMLLTKVQEDIEHVKKFRRAPLNQNLRVVKEVEFWMDNFPELTKFWDNRHFYLSQNPMAISHLTEKPERIHRDGIMMNPAAEELIKEQQIPINNWYLTRNSASWAVEYLKTHNYQPQSNFFSLNENDEILEMLFAHPERIYWAGLSQNPKAIDYLRAHPEKVRVTIYANPAAFELTLSHDLLKILLSIL